MALTINGEEVYPSSLTPDPHVLTVTIDGIPYHINKSATGAKKLRLRDPKGNPIDITPELEAKIFEAITDAQNNKAILDAQGSLEYGNQNTAELLPHESVGNNLGHAVKNYFDELSYRAKTDPSSIALQGKYTMPTIAASTLLPWLGGTAASTSIAGIPATTWANTAAAAGFAGHGLNHAINEGIDGWGDAAMTALEITPLGRLARPMWNAAKPTRNFIPTLESNMSGVRYAYNRNPELANIGTLGDYNDYLKTVFPESKVRDINYHMGPKGLQELKPSTGKVYNTNPDARGIYVTPDKSYAQMIRKYTTDRLEKPSFLTYLKRNLTPGGWNKANDAFTDIYPVMIDTKNPLLTKGNWTWGIKDKKYQSLMDDYDAIVNSGPKWYQNFHSMPETIVPKTEQSLILGSDADVTGFRRFMSNPQITAENAANITPEQWTAAQDAAIARGDMAETQRLRDLHFKVKSGNDNTVFAHTTNAKFTEFDKSHFGETDEGFNGKGFYFSTTRIPEDPSIYSIAKGPKEEIPTMNYGKNKMYTYLKGDREFNVGNPERDFFEEPNTVGIVGKALDGRPHEVIIGNPNHIKSADAVTFDDNGVRIPLGLRDNFNINDIRYGLLPFGIGLGAAGTLYGKLK